jgi:hypothetical protein
MGSRSTGHDDDRSYVTAAIQDADGMKSRKGAVLEALPPKYRAMGWNGDPRLDNDGVEYGICPKVFQ